MKPYNSFEVETREIGKKSIVKSLLKNNIIPGVIYSKKGDNINIKTTAKQLNSIISDPSAFTRIYELKVNNKSMMCVLKEVQFNPAMDLPMHIVFKEVSSGDKVLVKVPIKIINKEICPGVKNGGDIYKLTYNVLLKCEVEKIPYAIEIDVKNSEMGDKFFLSDIKLPEGCNMVKDIILIRLAGRRVIKEVETGSESGTDTTASSNSGDSNVNTTTEDSATTTK